jgi:hypothetical protein
MGWPENRAAESSANPSYQPVCQGKLCLLNAQYRCAKGRLETNFPTPDAQASSMKLSYKPVMYRGASPCHIIVIIAYHCCMWHGHAGRPQEPVWGTCLGRLLQPQPRVPHTETAHRSLGVKVLARLERIESLAEHLPPREDVVDAGRKDGGADQAKTSETLPSGMPPTSALIVQTPSGNVEVIRREWTGALINVSGAQGILIVSGTFWCPIVR